jgi:hypothetical protein
MQDLDERLHRESNLWLATTRPDGRPHLTPIWFVWHDGSIWICTSAHNVKHANLLAEPRVMLSLESGSAPVLAAGHASLHSAPFPAAVAAAFVRKFEWDINSSEPGDGPYEALWEIAIDRWVYRGAVVAE